MKQKIIKPTIDYEKNTIIATEKCPFCHYQIRVTMDKCLRLKTEKVCEHYIRTVIVLNMTIEEEFLSIYFLTRKEK